MKIKHTQLSRYLCPVLGCREYRYIVAIAIRAVKG